MALFHTTVVDNQIKALDTIGTSSGAICTFDTDRAERLVSCVCEVASGNNEISIFTNSVNVWNETTKNGYYNATNGNYVYNAGQLCSNGLIKVQPDTAYFYYKPNSQTSGDILFFDSNGVYLNSYYLNKGNSTFTTPNNCYFIAINLGSNYGASYNNDVSINNDGSTIYNVFNGFIVGFGETLTDTATYDAISGLLTRNNSTTKQLDSCNIVALDNETNNVYCDTGNTEVNYIMTVGKAIS